MNGNYHLTVGEYNYYQTGGYSFRLLDKADAISVNLDSDIAGKFDYSGLEADSYRLTLTERQYLYFDAQIGSADNYWTLYGNGGQYVARKSLSPSQFYNGYTYEDPDTELILDPGEYWLLFQGRYYFAFNEYKLRIITPQFTTVPLALGTIINGSISELGEQNTYTFTGASGQQLFYDALGGNAFTVRFYDPAGRELFNADSRNDRAPHDGLTLPVGGTYRVVIDGRIDATGNYSFRLLDKAAATIVNLDTDIDGSFDNGGLESDSYRFTLTERQYLYFDSPIGSGPNAWILYGGNGQYITSKYLSDGYWTYNYQYSDDERWLDPGDYWLVLQGNGASAPNYRLRIITSALDTAPYTLGTTIRGRISEPGEQDTYTFSGTAGQQLFYDAFGGDALKFRFFDPAGREVFNVDSRNDRGPDNGLTLAVNGTYRVVIDGDRDGIGNYQFRLLDKAAATLVNPDTDIAGTFDNGGLESDSYRFTLTERQYLYFDSSAGDYPNAWILYGNGGQYLNGTYPYIYNDREFWLDPGEYWLVMQGNGAANGNYKLRIVTPELLTAPLTLNRDITGTISEKGEQDYYTFTGSAGQELFYDSLGGDYLKVYIYDPAGSLIFDTDSRYDRGPDYYSYYSNRTGLVLPMDGIYRVTVDGDGEGTGNYKFRFLDRSNARVANLDTDITGTWDNAGRGSDAYRFSLDERTYLYFDSIAGTGAWILYRENGQYVDSRDLRNNDNEFWLDRGNYFLVLQGYGDANNANYKLRIVTPTLNTIAYTPGDVINNSIAEKGEQDYYTFEETAGARLFFDSLVTTNNTYVSLTAPSGKLIFNNHNSRDNRINIVLDESGTYRLTIDGSGETTENYGFRLLEYGAAFSGAVSRAVPVTLDTEIAGYFDDPQQRESDFYRFIGSAGQYLYIDTLAGQYPNGWTIFRPNGELLISGYLYEDKEISLPDTGEYTLEAWGNGSGDRNYKLKLITPELNTIAYTLGSIIASDIREKGEQDTYTFDGTAGQWVYLDILAGSSNLKAKLYSPTGILEIDGDTNADWTPRVLKETGKYRLVIDGVGESTGNYSFILLDRANATGIALGTTLNERLDRGNGVKLYQINGQAGQVLSFNYSGQTLTPAIDPATGHAYALTELAGSWTQARAIARAMGGDLVSINSAAENQFLVDRFGSSLFWIGLTDETVEGQWRWVNGDPYIYTNWYSGQPDNGGNNEDYAVLNWGGGRWNDVQGNYSNLRGIVENDGTVPLRSQLWRGANWALYDPSGTIVAAPGANSLADFQVSLAASGTYTLAVIGNSDTPASYEFQVTDVSPARASASGLNRLQSGTLDAGRVVNYNFTANAGTLVYLDSLDDSNWQIRYRLLNPDGTFLFADHEGRYDRAPFLLPLTGQYTLQVFGYYGFTTGNYRFNLLELPQSFGSPAANYLELGSAVSGALNAGETKIYTFEGLQNLKVALNMMTANGVTISLYNSNGTSIFSGNYDSYYQWYDSGLYTLHQNGKYYLAVSAFTGASRNYSFQFLTLAEAPEIAYGISERGKLTPGQASTFYTLRGDAGDRLYFDIQSTNAPNGNYRWILYGPGNNIVFNRPLHNTINRV
jgi:large repetitive protein